VLSRFDWGHFISVPFCFVCYVKIIQRDDSVRSVLRSWQSYVRICRFYHFLNEKSWKFYYQRIQLPQIQDAWNSWKVAFQERKDQFSINKIQKVRA